MDAARLHEIIQRFPGCRIAVLGDFFLDKYLDTDPALAEVSVESGKTAHQVVCIRTSPGAAGTIVNNLAALGAGELHVLGMTGDDGEGYELRKALRVLGCRTEGLLILAERFTPTYLKPRDCNTADLSGEHERYDTKNRRPMPTETQDKILAHLERLLPQVDALAIQDQVEEEDCGIITTGVRERLAGLASRNPKKIFWADSRSKIGLFRNVIIKVNAREAVKEVFRGRGEDADDKIVIRAVAQLRKRTGRPVFVTAGRRGIWVSDPEPALVRAVRVPEPTDPTGAGDSATAGAVLALCAGASPPEAALVANLVASITVQQLATTGTAGPDQLGPRLEMWLGQG
jgi:bifunctional ADP-heptose synthase (sugar kinase/adenylyltransferase)